MSALHNHSAMKVGALSISNFFFMVPNTEIFASLEYIIHGTWASAIGEEE